MAKILKCPTCGDAKIREGSGLVPYVLGKPPSSFTGKAVHDFVYKCACQTKLSKSLALSMAQWRALPDIPTEAPVFVMPEGHKPGGHQRKKSKGAQPAPEMKRLADLTRRLLAVPPAEADAQDRKWKRRKNKHKKTPLVTA